VNTCARCNADFDDYDIIDSDRFCPKCGWEKEAADKRYALGHKKANTVHILKEKPSPKRSPDSALRHLMFADAVQYPATMLSLAVLGLSIVYLAALSPVIGGGKWAVFTLVASGISTTIWFTRRYLFLNSEEYPGRIMEITDLRERERALREEARVRKQRNDLHVEFEHIDFAGGQKALDNMTDEYDQLQKSLLLQKESDPYSVHLFSNLIEETYKQGLSVLSDALYMRKAVFPSDKRLNKEVTELEKEIAFLECVENQIDRLAIKREILKSHKQRLGMLEQLQLQVDQFLYQASLCESSLHRTRIELSALSVQSSDAKIALLTETLRGTIQDVKDAQEELRRMEK
jgi:hypothetical protein